jgi:SOCE-associated regulatory factor of calcium homoeostasis
MTLWIAFLLIIAYSFFKSCLRGNSNPRGPSTQPPGSRPRPFGWFPGDHFNHDAPPPYSKSSPEGTQSQGWRPGFWTGAAVGAAGAHLFNRSSTTNTVPPSTPWDWERERTSSSSWFSGGRSTTSNSNDRGEGSSNLGATRRSTGLGGSNVR